MYKFFLFFYVIIFFKTEGHCQAFKNEDVFIIQLSYKKGSFKGIDFYILNRKGNVYSAEYFENNSLKCLHEFSNEEKLKLIEYIDYSSLSYVYNEFRKIPFLKAKTNDTTLYIGYNLIKCKLTFVPSCAYTSNTTTILKCNLVEPSVILPIGIDLKSIIINKINKLKFKRRILKPAIKCLNTTR